MGDGAEAITAVCSVLMRLTMTDIANKAVLPRA